MRSNANRQDRTILYPLFCCIFNPVTVNFQPKNKQNIAGKKLVRIQWFPMSSQGQIKSQVVLGSSLNPPCQGYDVTYNPQIYDECIYIYTYGRYVNVTMYIYIYVILGKFVSGTCHLFSSWCSEWTFVTLKLKVFRTFIVKKLHSQGMNLWNIEIHTVDGSEILNNHMGCKKNL